MELISVSEGRERKEEISGEAKTWLISVACQKPTDLGYAAETWTTSALTRYIRQHVEEAGYGRFSTISESGVFDMLNKRNIKPFHIRYYCERRDPDFVAKCIKYSGLQAGFLQFDNDGNTLPVEGDKATDVFSHDEQPGIQVVADKSDDLMSNENNGVIMRDYKYRHLGTVFLLAGIDLQIGEAIPLVSDTHTSDDYYIAFLKIFDEKYLKGDKIRLVSDNLKVHSSVRVQEYFNTFWNVVTVTSSFESISSRPVMDYRNFIDFFKIPVNTVTQFRLELTRIPLSICFVILLKKPSTRFNQEACLGVNTNSNRL